MNKEKLKMLKEYINVGILPILIENVSDLMFEDAIILEANCDIAELNGHYEGINFVAPSWYNELEKRQEKILIINNINQIDKEEQTKFIEILKYRKVSTFDLDKNCIIIVTANNLKENPINQEVYSLMVHI